MPTLPMSCSGRCVADRGDELLVETEGLGDQRCADPDPLGVLVGVVVVEVSDGGEDREALARGVELAGPLANSLAQDGVAVAKAPLKGAGLERVADTDQQLGVVDGLGHEVADAHREGPAPDLRSRAGRESEDRQAVRALGEVADRVERLVGGAGNIEIEQHQVGALGDAELEGARGVRGHDVAVARSRERRLDQPTSLAGSVDEQ